MRLWKRPFLVAALLASAGAVMAAEIDMSATEEYARAMTGILALSLTLVPC